MRVVLAATVLGPWAGPLGLDTALRRSIGAAGDRVVTVLELVGGAPADEESVLLVSYRPLAASIEFSAQEERREACVGRGVDYSISSSQPDCWMHNLRCAKA